MATGGGHPVVLVEEDIPGASLKEPFESYTVESCAGGFSVEELPFHPL